MAITDGPEFAELYRACHDAGGMSQYAWEDDPKRLAFTLARYKHVAKLLEGYGHVLEVGCGDGYASRIVRQHVEVLTGVDIDAESIAEARRNNSARWDIDFQQANIETRNFGVAHAFDAVYSLDVLEHIDPEREGGFLSALHRLAPICVIGTPSLESQTYASALSKAGHVNCYSGPALRQRLMHFWDHVFLFTMNDEAIGTGFLPMAHYLMALCIR